MLFHLSITLLSISPTTSFILPKRDIPDNTQPYGTNPISISSSKFLGNQTADNSCSHRDLGFTGSINGTWYAIYGDAIWCKEPLTNPNEDTPNAAANGMVRDALSVVTNNPLKVHDLNLNKNTPVAHQNQFLPFNSAWGEASDWGFGGTSLCETNASEAAFFYLINTNNGLKGASVAKVSTYYGIPTVKQRYGNQGFWWNSTTLPRYGDQAAYRDTNSDYIYAWGGAPTSQTGYTLSNYVYQTRVQAANAFDLSKYEYWHGRAAGWSTTPLTTFNTETAVMWGVGQGQVVYSSYYNTYIYVHTNIQQVLLRTAPKLEGPWTADVVAYNATLLSGGLIYAGVAHPYLDTSGKTLTVSYTNSPNVNEVVKITFK